MSKIIEYLNKIRTAVYGKDVRQSIVNAIEQCYEDGRAGSIDLQARSQIANLVANANDTEGNSELTDVRVGVDGTIYDSAGAAVREQVNQLSEDLNAKTTELKSELNRHSNTSETDYMSILPTWRQKILLSTGVAEETNIEARATTDFIYVPKGMSVIVGYGSQTVDTEAYWNWKKVCIYNAEKNFLEVHESSQTLLLEGECYIRVYILRSVETANTFCSIQLLNNTIPMKNRAEIDDMKSKGSSPVSGSLMTLTDSSDGFFENVSFNGDANSTLIVSGKNLFRLDPTRAKAIGNNVTMEFSPSEGTVKIYTTEDGATANYVGPHIVTSVNGVAAYALYKIKFPVDTWITISSNPSEFIHFESDICMQIIDGMNATKIDRGMGYTFLAKAGVEYGVRFLVESGWIDTEGIEFKPQIEIGTHKTNFEPFKGCIVNGTEDNNNNAFSIESDIFYATNELCFSCKDGMVFVKTKVPVTNDSAVYCKTALVNGTNLRYICSFTPEVDTNVYIGCEIEPAEYRDSIYIQATDGTNFYNDDGNGVLIPKWPAGTECAIRFIVKKGLKCDWIKITPIVRAGAAVARSFNGLTNIVVSDGSTFSASYPTQSKFDKAGLNSSIYENINLLTSGFIIHPFEKIQNHKPMISFIDDDTTRVSFVKKYHDIFAEYGAVGNYAVMTARMTNADRCYDAEGELLTLLKQYELEGFGMLFHCYWQHYMNDPTLYFKLESRDISAVRDNLLTGLRDMQELGFNNYKHWVTPYGVNDEEIQNVAKELGLECLISMSNNSYISRGYADRWSIPRYSVSAISDSTHTKAAMDACAAENGWINIVTHVNSWGDTDVDVEAKLRDIIEYALSSGYEIVAFPQAFERWRSVFLLHELF